MAADSDTAFKLREENTQLKRQVFDLQDSVKRTHAKMVMMEEAVRRAGEGADRRLPAAATGRIVELESRCKQLEDENESLRRKGKVLSEKLRIAEEAIRVKAKLHGTALPPGRTPRPSSARPSSGGTPSRRGHSRSPSPARPAVEGLLAPTGSDPSVSALQNRVAELTSALGALRSENALLRSQPRGGSHAGPVAPSSIAEGKVSIGERDLIELERQLRDRNAQVLLLKSRYDHLEAKASAERELYDRAVSTLEAQNVEIREMRGRLQATETDANMLRSRLTALGSNESELRKAREEVHRLESMITELAESPFIRGDGAGGGALVRDALSQRQRVEQLEHSDRGLRDQVGHLQHEVRGAQLELQAANKDKAELHAQLDKVRSEVDRQKASLDATLRANAVMRERLALYSGGAGLEGVGSIPGDALSIPTEELERALTIVRRKLDRPSASNESGAIVSPEGEILSTPALQRKVQQLQLALLESQSELERAERMVKAQNAISADLSAEVTELHSRLSTGTADLKKKLVEVEAVAAQRLQKLHMLEAQVAQLITQVKDASARKVRLPAEPQEGDGARMAVRRTAGGGTRSAVLASGVDDDASTVISDVSTTDEAGGAPAGRAAAPDEEDSLSASILSDAFNFGPGENSLEVYVVDALLDPSVLGRTASTFAMVDFLNFEAQQTPLGFGATPVYNHSALYTIKIDQFLLRYFAMESITIDISQARGTSFELLGRASVPLRDLLTAKSKVKHPEVPVRATNGKVVGSLKVELRLAMPLIEAWQAYCRDNPAEAAALSTRFLQREALAAPGSAGVDTVAALVGGGKKAVPNDLIISVVSAQGLRARANYAAGTQLGTAPSAYIQYTLPVAGAKTAFTPVVRRKTDPVFADSRAFPLVPTTSLLSSLATNPLHFIVCDDDAPAEADDDAAAPAPKGTTTAARGDGATHRGVLGVATVSLASLAEGLETEGSYDVLDAKGARVGSLSIRMLWSRPLIAVDGVPPDNLTRAQFQSLAGAFDRDGQGVKYQLFARAMTASDADYAAIERVQAGIASHMKDSRVQQFTSVRIDTVGERTWADRLRSTAEATHRPGKRLIPREIFDTLTSSALTGSRIALELATIEDAVLCLLGPDESSINVDDVIDVFTPNPAATSIAAHKVRRYYSEITARQGSTYIFSKLDTAAKEAGTQAAGRLGRNQFAAALRDLGMLIVEDTLPRAFASSWSKPAVNSLPEEEIMPSAASYGRGQMQMTQQAPFPGMAYPYPTASFDPRSGYQTASAVAGVAAGMRSSTSDFAFDLLTAADRISLRSSMNAADSAPSAPPPQRPAPHSDTTGTRMPSAGPVPAGASTEQPAAAMPPVTSAAAGAEGSTHAAHDDDKARSSRKSHSSKHHRKSNTDRAGEAAAAPGSVVVWSMPAASAPSDCQCLVITATTIARIQPVLSRLISAHLNAVAKRSASALHTFGQEPRLFVSYSIPPQRPQSGDAPGGSQLTVILHANKSIARATSRSLPLEAPAGETAYDIDTAFPVASKNEAKRKQCKLMAEYLSRVLNRDAAPEEADITFTLSILPPAAVDYEASIIATCTYSLRDLLDEGDTENAALPLYASRGLPALLGRYDGELAVAGTADGGDSVDAEQLTASLRKHNVVADLMVSFEGVGALKAVSR